ncbi:MAG: hypothetical protein PHN24_00620 [Eubacteriales bacterium]|nr:hypothetical protein [Eubacteriales bacterium]
MAGLNIGEGAKEARGARLDKLAKAVRVLSVPPVLVGLLLTALWIFSPSVFSGVWQPLVTLFGLAVVPALAYPLSMIPALRKGGRDAQRDLALKLTPIGYVISTVFCWISGGGSNLWLINLGYLFSIIVLLLLNKVFHLKASGHACAITGPLIYAVIFFGWGFAPVCALLYALIFWSSLRLERHTPRDLLLGTLTACCALGIAAIIVSLF